MEGEDCGAGSRAAMVNAPFIPHAFESPALYCIVECLIPDTTCLFHPIDTLLQLPNPVLLARFLEARRLFHVHRLVRRENAVEKSRLYIELLYVPAQGSGEMEDKTEGLKEVGRCGVLIKVSPVYLSIAFRDIPDLITD